MKTQNRIYIVGAGAVGKALAVFLTIKGKDVVIIRGSVDDHSSYTEKISVQYTDTDVFETTIQISSLSQFNTLTGIVILTNKSYGNQDLSKVLAPKIDGSPLVIMQNGLEVEAPFTENHFPEIYRCVLFTSCQMKEANAVQFKRVSISPIGIVAGNQAKLDYIVSQLQNDHLAFRAEENIQSITWKKAIINCVFNSICPLLETDNGIFHRNSNALAIAQRIISDCVLLAEKAGIALQMEDVIETLLMISRSSDGQLISTYQDLINKRKTEIDSLNFALAKIGSRLWLDELVKETRLLGELISIKSEIRITGE